MSRLRRSLAWLFVAGVVAAGVLCGWRFWVEPKLRHSEWDKATRLRIKALADKRPPDVPPGRWEFAVGWTINLHGNCGVIDSWVDAGWRDGFAAEFDRRLVGPLTPADIDWVWDEYEAHTKGGRAYSQSYRPTRAEEFGSAEPGCFGLFVK